MDEGMAEAGMDSLRQMLCEKQRLCRHGCLGASVVPGEAPGLLLVLLFLRLLLQIDPKVQTTDSARDAGSWIPNEQPTPTREIKVSADMGARLSPRPVEGLCPIVNSMWEALWKSRFVPTWTHDVGVPVENFVGNQDLCSHECPSPFGRQVPDNKHACSGARYNLQNCQSRAKKA